MPVDQNRVKDLFVAALAIADVAARNAFVDRECIGDPELDKHVRDLLQAHDAPHPALNAPVVSGDLTTAHLGVSPGMIIAEKYKLLQHIGEGGMGSVWMADQVAPVKRRVAVKLIHTDRGSSKTILARFEAERQAIALMDHPNIAKLLDAGTTDAGMPFFAMELVKGIRLTQYCDDHKLSVPERLALFQQICSAVQHAHQKGIIHRDLKPSNVLVESHDGKAITKVIDFGLAKAITGQQLTENTLFTALGQVAGTPLYMAPEQAAFNALDIDTRADIYSLGVILYELLTGSTPIERVRLKQAAFDEILRLVRENEPPVPSKRLSTTTAQPNVAVNRQLEPAKLGRFVKGELDWIVMKALAKERDRRYESASGFAKDIERFLRNEPVQAGPPSATYKLRKFVRRNRPQVMAAALVLMGLIASVVGTSWGLIEARKQERIAQAAAKETEVALEKEARRAESEQAAKELAVTEQNRAVLSEKVAKESLELVKAEKLHTEEQRHIAQTIRTLLQTKLLRQADVWVQADALALDGDVLSGADRNVTVRELLDRAAKQLTTAYLDENYPNQFLAQVEILKTVGATYVALNELTTAIELLNRAVTSAETHLGQEHPTTILARDSLARAHQLDGRLPKAIELFERNRVACEQAQPIDVRLLWKTQNNLGLAYLQFGRFHDAVTLLERVLESLSKPESLDSTSPVLNNLGFAYKEMGNPVQAAKYFQRAYDIDKRVHAQHPQTFHTLRNLAITQFEISDRATAMRRMEEVCAAYEKLFGPEHLDTLRTQNSIALMLVDDGKESKAIELLERIQKTCEQRYGTDHVDTVRILSSVGSVQTKIGRHKEAIETFAKVRSANEKIFAADHPQTLNAMFQMAEAHLEAGQVTAAITLLQQIRTTRVKLYNFDRLTLAKVLRGLGMAQLVAGRAADGVKTLIEARECLGKETDSTTYWNALEALGVAYAQVGNTKEAIPLLEQARALFEKNLGRNHSSTLTAMNDLALAHKAAGNIPVALQLLQAVVKAARESFGPEHTRTRKALNNLGDTLNQSGHTAEAIETLKSALDIRSKQPPGDPLTLTLMTNLASAYQNADRLDEAVHMLTTVRDARVQQADPEHPLALLANTNLAEAYRKVGRLREAIQLLESIRDMPKKAIEPDHTTILLALSNLAICYRDVGRSTDALGLLLQVRDRKIEKFGADDRTTLATLYDLAMEYQADKKVAEALALLRQVNDAFQKRYNLDDDFGLRIRHAMAMCEWQTGPRELALEHLKEVRGTAEKTLSVAHPFLLQITRDLALMYLASQKSDDAIVLAEQFRDALERKLDPVHERTLQANTLLLQVFIAASKHLLAAQLHKKVRDQYQTKCGVDDVKTLRAELAIGLAYRDLKQWPQVIETLQRIRDRVEARIGRDDAMTLKLLDNLAVAYRANKELDKAVPVFEETLRRMETKFGHKDPRTLQVMASLGVIYREAGKFADGLALMADAYRTTKAEPQMAWLTSQLLAAYVKDNQLGDAGKIVMDLLEAERKKLGADSLQLAMLLENAGRKLMEFQQYPDAELILRECLALRERLDKQPGTPDAVHWRIANTKWILGAAVLGQKNYIEAEQLLRAAVDGLQKDLKAIPPGDKSNIRDAIIQIVRLYEALDKKDEAAKWRKELDALPDGGK